MSCNHDEYEIGMLRESIKHQASALKIFSDIICKLQNDRDELKLKKGVFVTRKQLKKSLNKIGLSSTEFNGVCKELGLEE